MTANRRPPSAVLCTITQERGHGGIARVSVLLWEAMKELAGNRRLVTLLKNSREPELLDKLRFAWEMIRIQWRGEARWIVFDHVGLAAVQNLVPQIRRAPYAVFLHGVEAWCPLPQWKKRVLRGAAVRIANSQYTAERIAGVHPDIGSIAVCNLALPDPQDALENLPETEIPDPQVIARVGAKAVLIVGRMASAERYKGHDQLIEAWPMVVRSVPDAQLIITGWGDDLARLKAAAVQTGYQKNILFTGRVSDATLDMLYGRASVFAMPARGEGFGIVYLEAMRHSLPCIASIHDAAGEVVEHGKTGFLVDQANTQELADVIVLLLQNSLLRKEMGEAGRDRVKAQFSFAQFKTRFASAIRPLLKSHPRA